jgi:NADH-quinone oxidoreductase subunit A
VLSWFFGFFIFASTLFSAFLFFLSYILASQNPDSSKLSAYECGFLPFEDARDKFEIKFYIVAILFVIFDLEISFLFPWAVAAYDVGILGLINMFLFLFILTLGFVFEWERGILDW